MKFSLNTVCTADRNPRLVVLSFTMVSTSGTALLNNRYSYCGVWSHMEKFGFPWFQGWILSLHIRIHQGKTSCSVQYKFSYSAVHSDDTAGQLVWKASSLSRNSQLAGLILDTNIPGYIPSQDFQQDLEHENSIQYNTHMCMHRGLKIQDISRWTSSALQKSLAQTALESCRNIGTYNPTLGCGQSSPSLMHAVQQTGPACGRSDQCMDPKLCQVPTQQSPRKRTTRQGNHPSQY